MNHFIICVALVMSLCVISISAQQSSKVEELTVDEARKITPFPPVGLTTTYTHKGVALTWKRHALDIITKYGVYRSRGKGAFHRIATTSNSTFFDKKGRCNDMYTVTAISAEHPESPRSASIKVTNCKR